jgi:hypothetical protein
MMRISLIRGVLQEFIQIFLDYLWVTPGLNSHAAIHVGILIMPKKGP